MLQVVVVALLALVVGVLLKGVLAGSSTVSAQLRDGKRPPAPNFTLDTLDGGTFTLSSTRGKPVVLNFWASWCGPCKDEAPVLAELAHRYGRKLDIVGVNSQDDIGDARSFAQRYGLDFTVVHDTGPVYRKWGLGGLPETFVIAPDGKVVKHFPGQITGSDLEQALQPYVEGS